jgi:hypothetical protein
MNDPFEERLKAMKPGTLPAELKARLVEPKEEGRPAPQKTNNIIRFVWPIAIAAAAACLALLLSHKQIAVPHQSSETPTLASSNIQRVTEVLPLSSMVDESQRTWKFVEVQWVEQTTVVSAAQPVAVQLEDRYSTVIPVAIAYD